FLVELDLREDVAGELLLLLHHLLAFPFAGLNGDCLALHRHEDLAEIMFAPLDLDLPLDRLLDRLLASALHLDDVPVLVTGLGFLGNNGDRRGLSGRGLIGDRFGLVLGWGLVGGWRFARRRRQTVVVRGVGRGGVRRYIGRNAGLGGRGVSGRVG